MSLSSSWRHLKGFDKTTSSFIFAMQILTWSAWHCLQSARLRPSALPCNLPGRWSVVVISWQNIHPPCKWPSGSLKFMSHLSELWSVRLNLSLDGSGPVWLTILCKESQMHPDTCYSRQISYLSLSNHEVVLLLMQSLPQIACSSCIILKRIWALLH